MTKYKTERGSTYEVEDGFWRKNQGSWNPVYWLKALPKEHFEQTKTWQDVGDLTQDRPPEVGERLYIGCKDSWWLSTPIGEVVK